MIIHNKYSAKDFYLAQKQLRQSIQSIPKKNREKFSLDLIKLIDLAHGDNYEDYYF